MPEMTRQTGKIYERSVSLPPNTEIQLESTRNKKTYIPNLDLNFNELDLGRERFEVIANKYFSLRKRRHAYNDEVSETVQTDIDSIEAIEESIKTFGNVLDKQYLGLLRQRNRVVAATNHNEMALKQAKDAAVAEVKAKKPVFQKKTSTERKTSSEKKTRTEKKAMTSRKLVTQVSFTRKTTTSSLKSQRTKRMDMEDLYLNEIQSLAKKLPNPLELEEIFSEIPEIDETAKKEIFASVQGSVLEDEIALYSRDQKAYDVDEPLSLDDSLIEDIERQEKDALMQYEFMIPRAYQLRKNTKRTGGSRASSKKLIQYVNDVVDVYSYTEDLTRIFPDGYRVTYFKNGDLKLTQIDKVSILLHKINGCVEIFDPSTQTRRLLFRNGLFEKTLRTGDRFLKMPNGKLIFKRTNGDQIFKLSPNEFMKRSRQGKVSLIWRE